MLSHGQGKQSHLPCVSVPFCPCVSFSVSISLPPQFSCVFPQMRNSVATGDVRSKVETRSFRITLTGENTRTFRRCWIQRSLTATRPAALHCCSPAQPCCLSPCHRVFCPTWTPLYKSQGRLWVPVSRDPFWPGYLGLVMSSLGLVLPSDHGDNDALSSPEPW